MSEKTKPVIQVLVDNPKSWIVPYCQNFVGQLRSQGYVAELFHHHEEVKNGDVLVLLSCEKKFKELGKNKFNLVAHESALPQGKGWSPLTWQVLEGKKQIPITLFEAAESIDSGKIYETGFIKIDGHELVEELRQKQFQATQELIQNFLKKYPANQGVEQKGESTFYPRRGPADSEIDVNKTINEIFPLLQVVDNEKYPAFFIHQGQKYILKIYKDGQK